jgi:tetratricopeptide (TPR) repeat protein
VNGDGPETGETPLIEPAAGLPAYLAFISYSHADEKVAAWLHRALETYRIPATVVARHGLSTPRLVPIFRDREELATSDSLSDTITRALSASKHLIVVCSPAAAASRWVDAEIRQFRALRPDGSVLCLLTDEPAVSFPPAILEAVAAEPLAADLREHADGRDGAKLKLIAGLLGIGLDELKRRDHQRRQRRLVTISVGALVGMSIAIGLATVALLAEREAQRAEARAIAEAARANQEARTAERTLGFLTEILREADPARSRGVEVPVREVLERAATRLESELEEEPLVRGRLFETIGDIYDGLGAYERSSKLFETGVAVYQDTVGPDDPRTLRARTSLATAWWRLGRYDEAEPILRENLAAQTARLGAGHADTLKSANQLASILYRRGDYTGAEALYRQVWTTVLERDGQDAIITLDALHNLANAVGQLGRTEEAAGHFEHILERRRALQGADHPDALGTAANLASLYSTLGRHAEAEALEIATLETRRRVLGPEHPDTMTSLNNLAYLYGLTGRNEEALDMYRTVIDVRTRTLGPEHPATLEGRLNFGMTLSELDRYDESAPDLAATTEALTRAVGADHPITLLARTQHAVALVHGGNDAEAERLLEAALPDLERALGASDSQTLDVRYNLACIAARGGDAERALDHLEQAVADGFADPRVREDPDFASLREHERFSAIVARIDANAAAPSGEQPAAK